MTESSATDSLVVPVRHLMSGSSLEASVPRQNQPYAYY